MPTTAYAITVTPPSVGGYAAPVAVRFEDAAAPGASPFANRPSLTLNGSLIGDSDETLISDVTTFHFVAATAVNLHAKVNGDDVDHRLGLVPLAYASPLAIALQPSSSGADLPDLASQYLPYQLGVRGTPFAPPTKQATYQVIGIDDDGTIWYVHQTLGIKKSTDGGTTLGTSKGVPSGITNGLALNKIVKWGGSYYLAGTDSTNVGMVWKSPDPGSGSFTWTTVLTMATGSSGIATMISGNSTYLFVGEYGDPVVTATPTAKIYRTSNGTSWTAVKTFPSTVRHVHAVYADPTTQGTIVATVGDSSAPYLYVSTDNGDTWTGQDTWTIGFYSVAISSDASWFYFAPDASYTNLVVVARGDTAWTPKIGTPGHHMLMPVPEPGVYVNGVTTSGSNVFTVGAPDYVGPFSADDIGRKITGTGIPAGTTIETYTSSGTVGLSANCTATASAVTYRIDRNERWRSGTFHGAVGTKGRYYFVTNDDTLGGSLTAARYGLFCVPQVGMAPVLMGVLYGGAQHIHVNADLIGVGPYVFRQPN